MPKGSILKIVLLAGDVFLLYAALAIVDVIRHGGLEPDFSRLAFHFTFIYIFWILLLYVFDWYEIRRQPLADTLRNLTAFLVFAFFGGAAYFYFQPNIGIAPKTILLLDVFVFGALMAAWRFTLLNIAGNKNQAKTMRESLKIFPESVDAREFAAVSKRTKGHELAKKIIDLAAACAGLAALGILLPFIAPAIAVNSPGSIFYTQRRVGKNGKMFVLYKLRTMVRDAEMGGPRWAGERDARVTKVGRVLRRTHLDELPQAINLLRGELSLVGPRPERPEFVTVLKKEIYHYRLRELVKPGILGWAQLNFPYGDSVEDAREKLQYELYYIKHRSLFMDLAIVLKSLKIVLFAQEHSR